MPECISPCDAHSWKTMVTKLSGNLSGWKDIQMRGWRPALDNNMASLNPVCLLIRRKSTAPTITNRCRVTERASRHVVHPPAKRAGGKHLIDDCLALDNEKARDVARLCDDPQQQLLRQRFAMATDCQDILAAILSDTQEALGHICHHRGTSWSNQW